MPITSLRWLPHASPTPITRPYRGQSVTDVTGWPDGGGRCGDCATPKRNAARRQNMEQIGQLSQISRVAAFSWPWSVPSSPTTTGRCQPPRSCAGCSRCGFIRAEVLPVIGRTTAARSGERRRGYASRSARRRLVARPGYGNSGSRRADRGRRNERRISWMLMKHRINPAPAPTDSEKSPLHVRDSAASRIFPAAIFWRAATLQPHGSISHRFSTSAKKPVASTSMCKDRIFRQVVQMAWSGLDHGWLDHAKRSRYPASAPAQGR